MSQMLFAVRVSTERGYNKVYVLEANNPQHAKNLAEAKFYESSPNDYVKEEYTQVWKVDEVLTQIIENPSKRV